MIREFENVIRKHVDLNKMNANTLMKDRLKEMMLDTHMVKHYSNELFGDTEDREIYVEECLNIFLTVRGFAVAKLINKKVSKTEKQKKSSHSLRDTLKDVHNSLKKK